MAASRTRASRPIQLQQFMRLIRRIEGDLREELYRRISWARVKPQLGWVDFRFLHRTGVFSSIIGSLECDFWDRETMERVVRRRDEAEKASSYHSLMDMMLKVVDIDRTVSTGPRGLPN